MTSGCRILTYVATEGDTPAAYVGAARFMLPDGSMHPVILYAPSVAEVRAKAEAWWAEQIEIAKRRNGLTEERLAAKRDARAKAAETKRVAAVQP